jgi:5'-nucleotidase
MRNPKVSSYILLTNDDGIDSPGLLALKQAVEKIGEVAVVAPDHNWSAAGHTKTMHKPLRVNRTTLPDGFPAYTTSGTPSDCVSLALMGILQRRPDLVISGINNGHNLGQDLTYSGTVTAAMEAVVDGVPAMAVSFGARQGDFSYTARFAAGLATLVLEKGLPPGTLLNVNVPALPAEKVRGVEITRLGKRVYRDSLVERKDPYGRNYYWIGGQPPTGVAEEGTDIWAIANNYISITPIHLDLTEYSLLEELKGWEITT